MCAIYSSFLQRGYDQIVHDVALQKLPVRFAMDRAGLVGADGATHSGFADVTYMGVLPNMVIMAVRPLLTTHFYFYFCLSRVCGTRQSALMQTFQRFPLALLVFILTLPIMALSWMASWPHGGCIRWLPGNTHLVQDDRPQWLLFIPALKMGVCVQPSNEAELCNAVATAVAIDDQPSCFRFPRGNGIGVDFAAYGVSEKLKGTPWEVCSPCICWSSPSSTMCCKEAFWQCCQCQ